MHKLLFILGILLTFGVSAQSYTKISDPTECKNRINQKSKTTSSISAKFDEEIKSSMFNDSKHGTGLLLYKKENKIRWEHFTPKKQIVLINEGKIRFSENGKEIKNTASNQIIKRVQSLMIQLFSGDFLNEKEFRISYYESTDNYKLVLRPKSGRMSRYIVQVEMYFNKKSLKLNKMVMEEGSSDKIIYKFKEVKMNASINSTRFTSF